MRYQNQNRFSVSQTRFRSPEVLRLLREGCPVIITYHGREIVRIEAIASSDQLTVFPALRLFSEVRDVRAPTTEHSSRCLAFELLLEDRERR
jgi:antitoxin (DNA-binding transcriptional repressor) of toxin-antitoxin stability system